MAAEKKYPADSGEPIAVWPADIDCEHEDECECECEDDDERGVWVDTRVASDTLSHCHTSSADLPACRQNQDE